MDGETEEQIDRGTVALSRKRRASRPYTESLRTQKISKFGMLTAKLLSSAINRGEMYCGAVSVYMKETR